MSARHIALRVVSRSLALRQSDIIEQLLGLPGDTRVMLLAPVVENQKGEFRDVLAKLAREGFVRARIDGELTELEANARSAA